MRALALVGLLLSSALAYGQPATPSLDKLPLKKLKFEIAIDDLQGRWKIANDPTIASDATVFMTRPGRDMVVFKVGSASPSCSDMLDRTDPEFAAQGRTTASVLGLDPTFYATVRTGPIDDREGRIACMEVGGRTLVVQWLVDLKADAAQRASGAHLINAVGAGFRDVATGVPQQFTMSDGTAIRVADRSVLWHLGASVLIRVDDDSGLAANVAGGAGTCDEEIQAWRALHVQIVTEPSYLPPGWRPEVGILSNADARMIMMCLPRKDGGSVELQWLKGDPDAPEFGRVVRPVLEAFATAYGAPPPAAPAPELPPSPPVVDAPTPPVEHADTSSPTRLFSTVSVGVHNLSSERDGIDDGYGVAVGYQGTITRGGPFSLRLRTTLAYDTHSKAMFDGSVGVGFHSSPLAFHAVLGADGIGLGQDPATDRIQLPTDVYYGADATLAFTSIDVGFGYYVRSAEMAKSEYRIELGYGWFSSGYKWRRIAVRYTHYDQVANLASLGIAW